METEEQIICFDGSANHATLMNDDPTLLNGSCSNSVESSAVHASKSVIKLFPTNHTSGSSAIVMKNITNYAWSPVDIPGNLVGSHCSGDYIAYALYGKESSGQGGMVRIIQTKNTHRGLIKNIPGSVTDLSFAFIKERVLIACTDQFGSVIVCEIFDEEHTLRVELLVEAKEYGKDDQTDWWPPSDHQRVVWCPYIPEDNDPEDEENAYYLAVTNGKCAEIWHLGTVLQSVSGSISRSTLTEGYYSLQEHAAPITHAVFSPDGTALATTSLDGFVKFFQLNVKLGARSPKCIHEWNPHNGKPISSLFFLDDYKHPGADGLWKCAVTGAENNTELKLWSCSNWKCHQTINFVLGECCDTQLSLKANIDSSSKFIVISDCGRRVLLVLILDQVVDECPDTVEDTEKDTLCSMKFISVSQLPVQSGISFLAVKDASYKPYKRWKHELHSGDLGDYEGNDIDIVEGLVIQCYTVSSTSLSEATIRFQPALIIDKHSSCLENVTSSADSVLIQDGLTDISASFPPISLPTTDESALLSLTDKERNVEPSEKPDDGAESESPFVPPEDSNAKNGVLLLTPESFSATRSLEEPSNDSPCSDPEDIQDTTEVLNLECTEVNDVPIRSTSSTPSREVQRILSPDVNGGSTQQYFGDIESKTSEPLKDDSSDIPCQNETPDYANGTTWPTENLVQLSETSSNNTTLRELFSSFEKGNKFPERVPTYGTPNTGNLPNLADLSLLQPPMLVSHLESSIQEEIIASEERNESPDMLSDAEMEKISSKLDLVSVQLKTLQDKSLSKAKENKERLNQLSNQNKALENKFQRMTVVLEKLMAKLEMAQNAQEDQNKVAARLVQNLEPSIKRLIEVEIKSSLLSTVSKNLETIRNSITNQFKSLSAKAGNQIADQVATSLTNKKFTDSISSSVCKTLNTSVQSTTKKSYNEYIVPSLQSLIQSSLYQMNDAFANGTKEYIQKVGMECNTSRNQLHDNMVKSSTNIDSAANAIAAQTKHISETMNSFNEFVESQLRTMVKEEVNKCLSEYAISESRRTSRSQTPCNAPSHSSLNLKAVQQQITALVAKQDFNNAFKQALMVSDISLVVFVCERVNPQQLFSHPTCPLSQEVLLSLISQLSHDLSTFTDLKIKYLEEAVINLEMHNHVIKEYGGKILSDLQQALTNHLTLNPNMKKLKMLLLAVNQLSLQMK